MSVRTLRPLRSETTGSASPLSSGSGKGPPEPRGRRRCSWECEAAELSSHEAYPPDPGYGKEQRCRLPKRGKAEDHSGGLDWRLRGSLARVQLGTTLRRLNPYLRWLSGVPFTSAQLWHFTLREDVALFSSFVPCSYSRSTGRLRLRSHYALFETRRPVHLLLLTVHLPFWFTGFLIVCFHFMLMQGQTRLFNSTY